MTENHATIPATEVEVEGFALRQVMMKMRKAGGDGVQWNTALGVNGLIIPGPHGSGLDDGSIPTETVSFNFDVR